MTTIRTQTFVTLIVLFTACGQTSPYADNNVIATADTLAKTNTTPTTKTVSLIDTTIKFLWRDNIYDEALKDTFYSIVINEDYCKNISDPERAALGYVATFIGNECWWDGNANSDRSNLKCKILTALNLGYQCSDRHLGFLRQWFKNDKKSLDELESCPTTPYTSTIQDTFSEITLTIKGNTISIWFSASATNIREQASASWTETNHFQFDSDNLQLIKTDKSEIKREHFDLGE